ncbi:hypothetical protein LTR70_007458 [Exophiala xenobiotica]|uniref:C2H2-type domain-containing protein n=1 Tax=Lithohypha guttulata TaxID=1690604 RepID=A0ABR0K4C6_9EURO|nr:hypothetical protein LTR24_006998 [Lithohypha guttulata]KAK5313815.1 hypothetical protein LTR70_007458 [Exophiala xenobiotica]
MLHQKGIMDSPLEMVRMTDAALPSVSSAEPGAASLLPPSTKKTARDVERDLVRQSRQYQTKIESTTASFVRKPIASGTTRFYQVMLREWDLFVAAYDGLKDPANLKTAKDFILFFSSGRRGRNEPGGRLTVTYTHTAWKSFMAAWSRIHHMSFSKSHQDTILNFINGGEKSGAPDLSRKARPSRNFTRDDFLVCVQQLWQNDWHDFVHERYRVGLHLLLLLHCNTSGRRAEYEKELTYADISLAVVWLDGTDQPQLVIDFRRTKAKGLQNCEREQPQHMLYELVGLPYYCNSIAFFFAAALADGVLRDYQTWDEICAIPRPPQRKHVIIEYVPEKSHWPLFPRSSPIGHLDHSRSSASLTSKALLDLGFRAGFRDHLTLHAARREVLMQVDNYGYSCNERMRFAAHINPNTYRRSYQTSIPLVDGQASYFQYEPRNAELHALRRGYSWRRNPHHQPKLKEATRMAVREEISDDERDVIASLCEDPVERQKTYDQRRHQRDLLLREQTLAAPQPESRPYESDFVQTRKLMPERDRLATNLFREGSLRDDTGRAIMHDLIQLCRQETPMTYCLGLNASGPHCDTCGEQVAPGKEYAWWSHLYRCQKRVICHDRGFAEFCFLCFAWYDDRDAWQKHAQEHLRDLPLKCSMVVFRHNVVRPALCPACLGEGSFRQFVSLTTWKNHLQDHILRENVRSCPHPQCDHGLRCNDQAEVLNHLADVHDIRFESRKRQRAINSAASPPADGVLRDITFVHVDVDEFKASSAEISTPTDGIHPSGGELVSPEEVTASKAQADHEEMIASEQELDDMGLGSEEEGQDGSADNLGMIMCGIDNDLHEGAYENSAARSSGEVEVAEGLKKTTQTQIKKQPGLVIDVPPVPASWSNIPCMETMEADGASQPKSSKPLPRGRPPGSRNRRTLRRERRLATLAKTRGSLEVLAA